MKTIYSFMFTLSLSLSVGVFAQPDPQAVTILGKTADALAQGGGIRVTFGGTSKGTLLLDGERFYLINGDIQSWFDGKTQWTYLEKSGEVNISIPSSEELQGINPYTLLSAAPNGYQSRYMGMKSRDGKQGYEVILTPEQKQDLPSVTLLVSKTYRPLYIKVEQEGMSAVEIRVLSYEEHLRFDDTTFRFDKDKFPGVEVIDLR